MPRDPSYFPFSPFFNREPPLTEAELRQRYPAIVPGSLRIDPDAKIRQVDITCTKCGAIRERVQVQDLFQIHLCNRCSTIKKRADTLRRVKAHFARRRAGKSAPDGDE